MKRCLISAAAVIIVSNKKVAHLDNNNESTSKTLTTTLKSLSSSSTNMKTDTEKLTTTPSSSSSSSSSNSNEQKSDIIRRFHAMYLKSGGDNTNQTYHKNIINKDNDKMLIAESNSNSDNNTSDNKKEHDGNNDIDNSNNKDIVNPIKNIKNRKIELIGSNDKSTDKRASQAIQLLVNDTLTMTALEGIKDSHDLAQSIAKQLVLQVLTTPIYQDQFAGVLNYIFSYESVLSPTRRLIYWTIGGKNCFHSAIYQSKWQLNYLMHDIEPLGAKQNTVNQINQGLKSWTSNPLSRKNIIIPNISWYLNQNIDVIAKDVAKAITKVEEETIEGLSNLIVESLKSDAVRSAAREGILYYFKLSSGSSEKENNNVNK